MINVHISYSGVDGLIVFWMESWWTNLIYNDKKHGTNKCWPILNIKIKVDIFGAMTALGLELLSETILDWDLVMVSKIMFWMLQELNINILSTYTFNKLDCGFLVEWSMCSIIFLCWWADCIMKRIIMTKTMRLTYGGQIFTSYNYAQL